MAKLEVPLECIAFMLIRNDQLLVERRSMTKRVVPGVLSIPGGHIEEGEEPDDALLRELAEEVGVTTVAARYVCTLLHQSEEFRKLHYFAVETWSGEFVPTEADSLHWIGLEEQARLDLEVDRVALSEYLRVYRRFGGPSEG